MCVTAPEKWGGHKCQSLLTMFESRNHVRQRQAEHVRLLVDYCLFCLLALAF